MSFLKRGMRLGASMEDILTGSLWKQILRLFVPIIIGSFFQQLYNMVDTIVIGQTVGTEALAAVGATGSIISLLVGLFVGVASGATVIIAQYYGARDYERVSRAVHTALAMALSGGVVLMVIGIISARSLLQLMNAPDEILDDAALYMQVYYAGIIGNLLYNIGTGILRSVGDTKTPLYILILCCFVNIALDLLFVLVFHLAVFGVALATIISQFISAGLILLVLMRADGPYRVRIREIAFEPSILKQVVRIGVPNGLESVFYSISNVLIQASINGFGTVAVAAWSAIGRIDSVMWMVQQAFGISVSTIAGQNFGARNYERVKKTAREGLLMTLAAIVFISVIIYIFCPFFLSIFTKDAQVIEAGTLFLRILAPSYTAYVFIQIYSAVIRGAGESLQPMLITVIFICGLRLIWIFLIVPLQPSMDMVAYCYPVSWVITGGIFILYYLRGGWLTRCRKRQESL